MWIGEGCENEGIGDLFWGGELGRNCASERIRDRRKFVGARRRFRGRRKRTRRNSPRLLLPQFVPQDLAKEDPNFGFDPRALTLLR